MIESTLFALGTTAEDVLEQTWAQGLTPEEAVAELLALGHSDATVEIVNTAWRKMDREFLDHVQKTAGITGEPVYTSKNGSVVELYCPEMDEAKPDNSLKGLLY